MLFCTLNSLKNGSKSYYQHRGMWCTSYPWPQDPPCVLQDSRKPLGGRGESWHPFNAPICMKFSPNILGTNMDLLTPQAGVSGTSMSSKTPGSHLEDGESLDTLLMHQSAWNFHQTFLGPIWIFWHHKQGCQEPPCPPRLQEVTWRMGRVF